MKINSTCLLFVNILLTATIFAQTPSDSLLKITARSKVDSIQANINFRDTSVQVIVLKKDLSPATLFGSLADTTNYKPMAFSSISLIKMDSALYKNQFTDQNSQFNFMGIKPDTYRLLITRPTFADYEEIINLKEAEIKNLGIIPMLSKANLLREVLIKDRQAIRIKGDTTEFLVDSFLVNKNSNVEDLLKRLPGIRVDKTGKITAQGQEVKKVLVDGEEFFGNDPTIATRNLKAANVETVQVFDQKSEQTIQTGVDDGTKEKTINLTLKEEAKKGYFGKVGAGYGTKNDSKIAGVNQDYGTENRYEGEAMVNNFKNKRKASFFSTFSNTNKTGLDWKDREKYMGGNNVEYDEASGYMFSYFESDPNDYNGNGIPKTTYLGGFYGDKVKNDRFAYNLTATHRETNIQGADNNFTQYILPDTMYFNTQVNKMNSLKTANSINGKADIKFDSLTNLVIKANSTQTTFDNRNNYTSKNYNGRSQLVNRNVRENGSKGQTLKVNYSILFNKKFEKKGRSFTFQFNQSLNNNQSDGTLVSSTIFGDSLTNSEQKLDQLKSIKENGNNFGGGITYSEPLSKTWSVITDMDYHLTLNHSLINTYNRVTHNRVDSLSNDLEYNIDIKKGGISFRYITKKINASLGGRISYTNLTQDNLIKDTSQFQHFLNLFPSARINYKFATTSNLTLSYYGSTRQPTLQQINPIQDISNPLVILKGNPALQQNFDNDFNLSYNSYKPLSGRSIYLSMNYSYTFNDFANYDEVDKLGRKIYKWVNVDGNQSLSGYLYYNFKIKKLNLDIGQSLNSGYYRSANFINSLANTNITNSINYDLNLSYEKEEKYEFELSPTISYNHSISSLRRDVVTQYFTYTLFGSINLFLPKKFEFMVDAQWNVRQQTEVFKNNNNTVIVSAFISKKFLKSDQLLARIGVEDLLNQNIGFRRNASSNYINENTYIVLRRYLMVSLSYNFTKDSKKSDKSEE